jgi:hypothetical protein
MAIQRMRSFNKHSQRVMNYGVLLAGVWCAARAGFWHSHHSLWLHLLRSERKVKRSEHTLLSYYMARKKTQKQQKQMSTLVPHRTRNLSDLLERAKTGASAQAVKAYLDAGGSFRVLVHGKELLHYMALHNAHPPLVRSSMYALL